VNRYFISDLHLDETRPHTTALFKSFAEKLKENDPQTELYILGDLFESWIGDDYENELHNEVKTTLNSLTESGIKVFFLFGNRDFLIGEEFLSETDVELLIDPFLLKSNGKTILLTHGDQMCIDDVEYQTFRSIVRNPDWQKDFLNFPISKRLKIAGETKDASKQSKQEKSMEIMDVNEEEVLRVFKQHGVNTMIHGHTHRPMIHELKIDGRLCSRYVLGDWNKTSAMVLQWSKESLELIDLIN
jgi:UDP-2,3-diacylglucosamine hydrolase